MCPASWTLSLTTPSPNSLYSSQGTVLEAADLKDGEKIETLGGELEVSSFFCYPVGTVGVLNVPVSWPANLAAQPPA